MDLSLYMLKDVASNVVMAIKHWRFGIKKQLGFLEDFSVLISDGIPANRAIEMMVEVTRGLTHEVALNVSQKIGEGAQLADGMRDWFSPNITEIIRVGESGGALAQTIQSAIKALSQHSVAMSAFASAVAYPLTVIGMACGMIMYLNGSIFTQFRQIKPESEWPPAGQRLVVLAYIVQHWWLAFIIGVFVLIVAIKYILANYTGGARKILDNYPPFSLYRKLVASQFLETLGLLVENGIVFKSALRVMQYQASPYLSQHILKMEELLGTGRNNIADVLSTGLIEGHDLMRLRVMAEVKGFEHGLVRMGAKGTEETTALLKLIARIVGGLLLAVGGGLVVVIMQGVYMTGMSMGSA